MSRLNYTSLDHFENNNMTLNANEECTDITTKNYVNTCGNHKRVFTQINRTLRGGKFKFGYKLPETIQCTEIKNGELRTGQRTFNYADADTVFADLGRAGEVKPKTQSEANELRDSYLKKIKDQKINFNYEKQCAKIYFK